jgi:hypothetical protein
VTAGSQGGHHYYHAVPRSAPRTTPRIQDVKSRDRFTLSMGY